MLNENCKFWIQDNVISIFMEMSKYQSSVSEFCINIFLCLMGLVQVASAAFRVTGNGRTSHEGFKLSKK